MLNLLNCQFRKVPTEPLTHVFMHRSNIKHYNSCLLSKIPDFRAQWTRCTSYTKQLCPAKATGIHHPCGPGKNITNLRVKQYQRCFSKIRRKVSTCIGQAEKICAQSEFRVIKVIRMHAMTIKSLLSHDPSIRIVHYVRDPRGIVNSRKELKRLADQSKGSMYKESKMLCKRMLNDIKIEKQIRKDYPSSIKQLRYEDLAVHTYNKALKIYKFLGHNLPDQVKHWIKVNTKSKGSENRPYGTSRHNSTRVAFAWRSKIKKNNVEIISHTCSELLKLLNYPTS